MSKLFLICGILFTAYYIGIIVYAGIHASFAWIWAALGAVCWLALAVCRVSALQAAFLRIPPGIRTAAGVLLALGIALFLAAEGCIVSGMAQSEKASCDYLIVLGAQVKGTRVSRRLKAASGPGGGVSAGQSRDAGHRVGRAGLGRGHHGSGGHGGLPD